MNHLAEAGDAYQASLKLDPGNARALSELAYIARLQGGASRSATEIALVGAPLVVAVGSDLQRLIDALTRKDSAHGEQVRAAITASPLLARQLNLLASTGKLSEIVVVPNAASPAPFGGGPEKTTIQLRVEILDQAAAFRQQHKVDPLVFFLGRQGAKIASQDELAAAQSRAHASLKFEVKDGQKILEATAYVQAMLSAQADDDAKAAIAGWNDSFDAAMLAHGGPFSPNEAVALIHNQPFADLLLKSMTQATQKLSVPTSLVIALDPASVEAVSAALLDRPAPKPAAEGPG